MVYAEEYHIQVEGIRKGPYTFLQLRQLYDHSHLPEETLYWKDGMENWLPVIDLCGPNRKTRLQKKRKRQLQLLVLVLLLLALALALTPLVAPMLREGWAEVSQSQFTSEAAYWKARGFLRDQLKQQKSSVAFEPFDSARVTLSGQTGATVLLPSTLYSAGTTTHPVWHVKLTYIPARHEWIFDSASQ